ncbi:MAG: hypothetical protein ABIR57_02540 [Aeromicrobium sp.]
MSAVIKWVGAMLILGAASGLVWLWLAEPAEYKVTPQGAILDEQGAKGRFGVIVTFVVIGMIAALLWGLLAGMQLSDRGWVMVPVFALASAAAGLIAWRVGVVLGPPDPATVRDTTIGHKIPQRLAIDTASPFLVWPIFALMGLFIAAYSTGDRGDKGARHRDEVLGG